MDPLEITSLALAMRSITLFVAAFLLWKGLKPRWLLLISYITTVIISTICVKTAGTTSVTSAAVIWATEAPVYPIIFAISIRGTGTHTKSAASTLLAANSGASVGAEIRYAAHFSIGERGSYYAIVAFFSAGAIFPIFLNCVPTAKRQVDPIKDEYLCDS